MRQVEALPILTCPGQEVKPFATMTKKLCWSYFLLVFQIQGFGEDRYKQRAANEWGGGGKGGTRLSGCKDVWDG
jgi:hypothetical protein